MLYEHQLTRVVSQFSQRSDDGDSRIECNLWSQVSAQLEAEVAALDDKDDANLAALSGRDWSCQL